jgi:hypothetical protein
VLLLLYQSCCCSLRKWYYCSILRAAHVGKTEDFEVKTKANLYRFSCRSFIPLEARAHCVSSQCTSSSGYTVGSCCNHNSSRLIRLSKVCTLLSYVKMQKHLVAALLLAVIQASLGFMPSGSVLRAPASYMRAGVSADFEIIIRELQTNPCSNA